MEHNRASGGNTQDSSSGNFHFVGESRTGMGSGWRTERCFCHCYLRFQGGERGDRDYHEKSHCGEGAG